MVTHPDAAAFMRRYLRKPTDVTTRLVFADWLEETGTPSNTAWAYYIRAKAVAAGHPAGSPARLAAEDQAARHAPDILARLTIPAALFVGYPKSLLDLLPAENIVVRIGRFLPRDDVVDRVQEDIARHVPVLPLDDQAGALLVAHPGPIDARVIAWVRAALPRSTIVVRGDRDGIRTGLRAAYAAARNHAGFRHEAGPNPDADTRPELAYDGDPDTFLDSVLAECHRRGADILTFVPTGDHVWIVCRTGVTTPDLGQISPTDWTGHVMPVILRRGETTGTDFTVEVVRNGSAQAVRIWL